MRKRTRRKIYALVNPIAYAIEGASVTPTDQLDSLRVLELSAIDAVARGMGTVKDLSALRDMANLCEMMALGGVGPEALEPSRLAQREMIDVVERRKRTGRIGATGSGLESFRELFRWHDLQRTSISRSEYEKYIVKTTNAVKGGRATVVNLDN